jgi:NhaP-type Na+/H+ or K+/H+ antiporter
MILVDVALVLVGGAGAAWLTQRLRLPGLLGMLVWGIVIGPFGLDWLSVEFQERAPDISVTALVIVIVASFFAIDLATLRRDAATIGLVGTVPGLLEGFTIMALSVLLLDFTWSQGGILGFTIAVVSPAVVVPTMIRLKDEGWGMDKSIPVVVLSATNLDGLMAVILWLVFMTIEVGRGDVVEVVGDTVGQIVLGGALGFVLGYLAAKLADRTLGGRPLWLRTLALLAVSVLVFVLTDSLGLNPAAALLVFGLVFVNVTGVGLTDVGVAVGQIWKVASILLFVLIGSIADLDQIGSVLGVGLVLLAFGVMARLAGAVGSLAISARHLTWGERVFIGLGTTGKATVQATLAPLVIAAGVATAADTLAIAVLAIVVMAPVGATAIEFTYRRLLSPPEE